VDRKKRILQYVLLMSFSVEGILVLNQVLLFLGPGVCLVESESGRNTSAVGGPNVDGSYDYGLFQVSYIFFLPTPRSPKWSQYNTRILRKR